VLRSKSGQKAARSSKRKQARNRSIRSASKTYVAKAENLIQSNDAESAKKAVLEAVSVLDKAAKRKIIHPNTASRRISRLTKKLNKVSVATTAKAETAKPATKTRKKRTKKES
jgi:small subunit ribosomal protein S20